MVRACCFHEAADEFQGNPHKQLKYQHRDCYHLPARALRQTGGKMDGKHTEQLKLIRDAKHPKLLLLEKRPHPWFITFRLYLKE